MREGWNTGGLPYGYRAERVRITPAGRRPRYRTRLALDPDQAPVVRRIFAWRVHDRLSTTQIAMKLRRHHAPPPHDPITGGRLAWTAEAVLAILHNPKYLGQQVWGRRRHGKRVPHSAWVWSHSWAHPALVEPALFAAAQKVIAGSAQTAGTTTSRTARRSSARANSDPATTRDQSLHS